MPYEIETKLKVDSHEPVRRALQLLGAVLQSDGIETDTLFDRPDGSLRRQGIALRIRAVQLRAVMHSAGIVTVKGPVIPSRVKKREEIEIPVNDPQLAGHLFGLLGFVPVITYQKRRQIWQYKECHVCLDEPPYIGLFVEIEGPSAEAVQAVQTDLGLGGVPHVRPSYAAMLSAYCDAHGVNKDALLLKP